MPRTHGWIAAALATAVLRAGSRHRHTHRDAEPQPFGLLARRAVTALDQLGQPLPPGDRQAFDTRARGAGSESGAARAMSVLDGHVLAIVQVNPEARVSVTRGAAPADLMQAGTRLFLVKVINQAGITAPLRVTSPQSAPVSVPSWSSDLGGRASAHDHTARHRGAMG
jgi:hypothetical protein